MNSNENIREHFNAIRNRQKALLSAYTDTREDSPDKTVAELINRIGRDEARLAVAELLNVVGEWDGRISRKNRGWALTVEGAETGEEQNKHGIYLPSSPHPAHIDQIADVIRRLDENR
jgi:hypothetical protein